MSEMISVNDMKWPAEDALAMACAIFRTKGFTSTSTHVSSDTDGELRWTSKDHLSYQLVPVIASKEYRSLIKVNKEDNDLAKEIIKHYRKLSFGVLSDSISEYMQRVFSTTQNAEVTFKDFGVVASIPSVYSKQIIKQRIIEEAKSTKQEHIGVVGNSIEINIRYINVRYVQKLDCHAHDAVTDTGHLVNFLNKLPLGKIGETQKIRARVKDHGVNFDSKTIETKLNYVKLVDREFVWQ